MWVWVPRFFGSSLGLCVAQWIALKFLLTFNLNLIWSVNRCSVQKQHFSISTFIYYIFFHVHKPSLYYYLSKQIVIYSLDTQTFRVHFWFATINSPVVPFWGIASLTQCTYVPNFKVQSADSIFSIIVNLFSPLTYFYLSLFVLFARLELPLLSYRVYLYSDTSHYSFFPAVVFVLLPSN